MIVVTLSNSQHYFLRISANFSQEEGQGLQTLNPPTRVGGMKVSPQPHSSVRWGRLARVFVSLGYFPTFFFSLFKVLINFHSFTKPGTGGGERTIPEIIYGIVHVFIRNGKWAHQTLVRRRGVGPKESYL